MLYNHNYVYFENIFYILYNWFYSCCKKKRKSSVDFEKLMLESVEIKNKDIILFCLTNGANNLNECLKLACEKGYAQIVEIFLEKGADPVKGLRYSKSPNITRMLYRYYQKSENIN